MNFSIHVFLVFEKFRKSDLGGAASPTPSGIGLIYVENTNFQPGKKCSRSTTASNTLGLDGGGGSDEKKSAFCVGTT